MPRKVKLSVKTFTHGILKKMVDPSLCIGELIKQIEEDVREKQTGPFRLTDLSNGGRPCGLDEPCSAFNTHVLTMSKRIGYEDLDGKEDVVWMAADEDGTPSIYDLKDYLAQKHGVRSDFFYLEHDGEVMAEKDYAGIVAASNRPFTMVSPWKEQEEEEAEPPAVEEDEEAEPSVDEEEEEIESSVVSSISDTEPSASSDDPDTEPSIPGPSASSGVLVKDTQVADAEADGEVTPVPMGLAGASADNWEQELEQAIDDMVKDGEGVAASENREDVETATVGVEQATASTELAGEPVLSALCSKVYQIEARHLDAKHVPWDSFSKEFLGKDMESNKTKSVKCQALIIELKGEKSYDALEQYHELRTGLGLDPKTLLTVAVDVQEGSERKAMALVIMCQKGLSTKLDADIVEKAWAVPLPRQNVENIKLKKIECLEHFSALQCKGLWSDSVLKPAKLDLEALRSFFMSMREGDFEKLCFDAELRKGQGEELSPHQQAVVIPSTKRIIDGWRNNAVNNAVKKGLGDFIHWVCRTQDDRGSNLPEKVNAPKGVKVAEELEQHYRQEKNDRQDFNASSITHYILEKSGSWRSCSDKEFDEGMMWRERAQMLNGAGDIGKSTFHKAKARKYTILQEKQYYIFMQGQGCIEQLGKLSRIPGLIEGAGALVMADFTAKSQRGSLELDELKMLFSTKREGACIESKRHQSFSLPAELPKLFSFNKPAVRWFGIEDVMKLDASGPESPIKEPPAKRSKKYDKDDSSGSEGSKERPVKKQKAAQKAGVSPSGSRSSKDHSGSLGHAQELEVLGKFFASAKGKEYETLFLNTAIAGMFKCLDTTLFTDGALKKFDERRKAKIDKMKKNEEQYLNSRESDAGTHLN